MSTTDTNTESNVFTYVVSESQQGLKSHRPSPKEAVWTGVSSLVNVSEHAPQSLQQERQGDDAPPSETIFFLLSLLFFFMFHPLLSFCCFASFSVQHRLSDFVEFNSPWYVSYSVLTQCGLIAVRNLACVNAGWTHDLWLCNMYYTFAHVIVSMPFYFFSWLLPSWE